MLTSAYITFLFLVVTFLIIQNAFSSLFQPEGGDTVMHMKKPLIISKDRLLVILALLRTYRKVTIITKWAPKLSLALYLYQL